MDVGMFLPQGFRSDLQSHAVESHWNVIQQLAGRAEACHYDSVWLVDHLQPDPPRPHTPVHELWTLTAAVAVSTSTVRLGQMCTSSGLRNPALLAKIVRTIATLSNDRCDLGVGAGWFGAEFEAYGYELFPLKQRFDRFEEAVTIVSELLTEGRCTFTGVHHSTHGATCWPAGPAHSVPLWIAGGGERRTLRLAARFATHTNFAGTPEVFAHKSRVLREHCRAVGRDFSTITRSANFNVLVAPTRAELRERLDHMRAYYTAQLPEQQAQELISQFLSGHLVGTSDEVHTKLEVLNGLGLGYVIAYFPCVADDPAIVEEFARITDNISPAAAC